MSDQDTKVAGGIPGDVEALVSELAKLREDLREINSRLTRMERRLLVAFPAAARARRVRQRRLTEPLHSDLTPDAAQTIFRELVNLTRAGNEKETQRKVSELGDADLRLIVGELGIGLGKSKVSRRRLSEKLFQRIRESVMLSHHTYRNSPTG